MSILQITWEASPVIFSLGPLSVRWYGLFWALSFYLGYEITGRIFKRENVSSKEHDSLLIYIAAGSIIGARLGHCLFYDFQYYVLENPIEILYIWQGGLASHGGAFGIIIAMILYQKKVASKPFFWTADRLLIVVALAAMFIRVGNLMNHEIYGYVTDRPWGFRFITNLHLWMQGIEEPTFTKPVHPTAIYEGLGYLFIFLSMMWLYYKKMHKLFEGFLSGYFLIALFGWRFIVEMVKEPQESGTGFINPIMEALGINMGQLLSIPMIILGVAIMVYSLKTRKPAIT